jgi:hypothetical protein
MVKFIKELRFPAPKDGHIVAFVLSNQINMHRFLYIILCADIFVSEFLFDYSVYKKNLNPFKFKLAITYCSNLTALIALN